MKKTLTTILFLTIFSALFAPALTQFYIVKPEKINPIADIWEAVKMVESANNHSIINFAEGAYGCGQIRQIKLDEYNGWTGSEITLNDCLDERVSGKIFAWHCSRYNDLETAVKRWNGSGPATEIYWQKVKRELLINKPIS